jgi:16S rRNA (guanine966-N2)-methyltransferase
MRVIAGSAGGTRLARAPAGTRPLSDRAREGLFSSLGDRVPDARCTDLYAGTGALGIEALSRGASSCAFVDRSAAAVRTIRENLGRTHLADRAQVARSDVAAFLGTARGPFSLAFLDPPYAEAPTAVRGVLEALRGSLAEGGLAVLTRPSGASTDVIPVDWRVARRLKYGDSHVLVLEEAR